MAIYLVRSYVFYHIQNRSKIIDVYISMEKSDQAQIKLNLLAIITFVADFNQINFILKHWSRSRQPMGYHVPLIFNSYKNYQWKKVLTFYSDSLYCFTLYHHALDSSGNWQTNDNLDLYLGCKVFEHVNPLICLFYQMFKEIDSSAESWFFYKIS